MCGIIASIKSKGLVNYLIEGLKKEEYRGYDSCGIGLLIDNKIEIIKTLKQVSELADLTKGYNASIGIGHTRWATHGKNNLNNAHPHISNHGLFSLVHNGTIYNYKEIKEFLLQLGFNFYSDTDSEVIANLLEYEYGVTLDIKMSIENIMHKLEGTYALCIIYAYENKIFFAKKSSPLIIGIDDNSYSLISDLNAFQNEKKYIDLDDGEYGYISKRGYSIYKNKRLIRKKEIEIEKNDLEKESKKYNHFMEKEIDEIPVVIKRLINEIDVNNLFPIKNIIDVTAKIIFIASGTSYHASLISKSFFSKKTEAILASELYTNNYNIDKNDLYVFISQSGETMDVLKSLEYVKMYTDNILGITNVKNSSLYKKSKYKLLINAGREIAVASTKAYINEVLLLYVISCLTNDKKVIIDDNYGIDADKKLEIKEIAKFLKNKNNAIFIGKGNDYFLAKEASLKLKEVSYIHSEALYSGELKHGSIALIEENFPVFVISDLNTSDYLLSAIEEIKSRGGKVFIFKYNHSVDLGFINTMIEFFYLAYYTALEKGNKIDKPRNLAKSVTVE